MTANSPTSFLNLYLRFAAIGISTVAALVALGYVPTRRLAEQRGVNAMFVGCGISWIATLIGAAPICAAVRREPASQLNAVLMSTALRMFVVLILSLSMALSGWFEKGPLLVWVGIAYVVGLGVDTAYAVRILNMSSSRSQVER